MGKDVQVVLYELMESRGISSIRELGRITDIRHAALIELANQKRQNINFNHIKKLAESLNISDMNEIIRIIDTIDK